MSQVENKSTHSFPVFRAIGVPRKGPLDRLLSVFADVQAGEGAGALLLALNAFLLLAAYYLLKTVREALVLSEGGAEVKTYSSAGQALLLLAVVPAYGALASRFKRTSLVTWVTLFFVSNLALFYVLGSQGVREGVVFFLWVGIFNVLVIAQFWAFANDLYTEAQGKRLFPFVGAGSAVGAWSGAAAASELIKPVGPFVMMLVAAGMLVATVLLTRIVNAREARRATKAKAAEAETPLGKEGGFALLRKDRYLLLIALLILLVNVVNTGGEFILGKLVTAEAAGAGTIEAQRAFIGHFYGQFFSWVNLAGVLMQVFLVSRVFHYAGVGGALYILPLVALCGYSTMAVVPVLAVVRVMKVLENSTDYSIQNTARHALFLPTSREAKYKAKAAIDTFFWRAGDVLAAGVVFAGSALSLSVKAFAGVNLLLTLVWIGVVMLIHREYEERRRAMSA